MRTLFLLPIVGALLLCLASLVYGATDTIDVSAIQPGMKGHGMTVFRGTRPERFDVEVIDVLHNFRPDQDLILVRTHHPVLDKALVVGGMSGSPIYLDGKLAGAYAYGWLFGKEPIAGVTPIANMLTELVRPIDPNIWRLLDTLPEQRERPKRQRPIARAGLSPYLGRQRVGALGALRAHAERVAPRSIDDGHPRLSRAVTPLMLSGMSEHAVAALDSELSRFGLVALQGGGGGELAQAAKGQRYVDGGAIGVQLMRGDINATGIGTVTHVSGRRLIAFGHPMMNSGQPALPTAIAKVLHVFSSERRSFKLAEPIASLGTLIHDRQSAIVVDTQIGADTVPMRVRVEGAPGAPRDQWQVELASQRTLTPMLCFAALVNAISATVAEQNDVAFTADSKVRLSKYGEVSVVDHGYSMSGLANPMALSQLRLFEVLAAAYGNPFEPVRVEGIDVTLSLRHERDLLTIVDAMVSSSEVDPGAEINLYVTLRRYGQEEEVKIVPVQIPKTAAGDKIELLVEAGDDVQLQHPIPDDVDQLLDIVRAGYPADSIVVSTKLASRGVRMRGHVVDRLPGSALSMLQLKNEADTPKSFVTHRRTELAMKRIVRGSARVKLEVREEPR